MRHDHEMVESRDGTKLATDIYLPNGSIPCPAVIQRTPYGKYREDCVRYGEWLADHGYCCVIQDVRGRHDSQGRWTPYHNNEIEDGYDTAEWVANQSWCNRAIAFSGSSYLAFTGFMAALSQHPAIKALIARVPATGLFHRHFYFGGIFYFSRLWWAALVSHRINQQVRRGSEDIPVFDELIKENGELLFHLPVVEIGEKFPISIPWWRTWLKHSTEDDYWKRIEIKHQLNKIDLPIYHISGWHDDFCSETLQNYANFSHGRTTEDNTKDRLLMGMWPHKLNRRTDHGGIDYGSDAVIDLWEREKRWLDNVILGKDNDIAQEPPVRLFVMGDNKWQNFNAWPPEEAKEVSLFLREKNQLLPNGPKGREEPNSFLFDPHYPTPQPWDFGEPEAPQVPGYPVDDSKREDRLLFKTPPLKAKAVLIGPIILKLFAATDARDTDWFAWVGWEDYESKQIRLLSYGHAIRARFREGFDQPTLLKPGKIYKYEINLGATARALPKYSKIWCCVQSSCSPWFSRNLNTGGNNYRETSSLPAHQTIYHDRERPSRIILRTTGDNDQLL